MVFSLLRWRRRWRQVVPRLTLDGGVSFSVLLGRSTGVFFPFFSRGRPREREDGPRREGFRFGKLPPFFV